MRSRSNSFKVCAALLAGGTPLYLDCRADNDFRPDFSAVDADTWRQVQLVFLCSPGNPSTR